MLAREGYPMMLAVVGLAVLLFAAALRLRSWPLWLSAFVVTVLALCMAWALRESVLTGASVLVDLPSA